MLAVINTAQELCVRGLRVELFDEVVAEHRVVVSDVDFRLKAGHALGITGESGSGKTSLSLALGGLLPASARVAAAMFRLNSGGAAVASPGLHESSEAVRLDGRRLPVHQERFFTLFQEPRASLNPHRSIGWQLRRCVRKAAARVDRVARDAEHAPGHAALVDVGLDPDVARHFPHELSTGMCQRVFLAMASVFGASVLVADEPFASVDAATQIQLTALVKQWLHSRGMMLVLVSHDLELLRQLTDHTIVLFRGQVAEAGLTRDVLGDAGAAHPYTRLLASVGRLAHDRMDFDAPFASPAAPAACCFAPRCSWREPTICAEAVPALRTVVKSGPSNELTSGDSHRLRCVRHPLPAIVKGKRVTAADVAPTQGDARDVLLSVDNVSKEFTSGWFHRRTKHVLNEVSFDLREGDRLGIMGPSGQGKTTLARILVGVLSPTSGTVRVFAGTARDAASRMTIAERVRFHRRVQLLHQDADLVLDPAARIGDSLVEAYQVFNSRLATSDAYQLAVRLLEEMSLPASILEAYPYRLSGGERKRVALARCLAALGCPFEPPTEVPWRVLVLDEPTAGVDVVLQAILSRFLLWAQRRMRLAYLVISHDEEFVRQFCLRTLRLENGHVVAAESGPRRVGS